MTWFTFAVMELSAKQQQAHTLLPNLFLLFVNITNSDVSL